MNRRGPVRPCRWQNLSPLADWGAQGDVNEWTWPGATRQISESIAARGHPRGCYQCWPGVTRQRLWNLLLLGDARGDVIDRCGLVRPSRLQNVSPLGDAQGDVMDGCVLAAPAQMDTAFQLNTD